MPTKKSTRANKATKVLAKASSKPDVLDENAESSPVQISGPKTLSKKADTVKPAVLGERTTNHGTISASIPQQDVLLEKKTTTKGKKKKGASTAVKSTASSDVLSDTQSLPSKQLPEEQIQAFLQNYDLEAQARLSRLRASLEMSVQSALTRMKLTLERMPRAVRELTLGEFIDDYGADIHAFMNRAPVQHFEDGQREWQDALQHSPVKTKRTHAYKADDDQSSKAARHTNTTARASVSAASTRSAASKKATSRSAAPTKRSAVKAPPSPAGSMPAPSLATFNPNIPKETPRPRMARPGEMIQWQSINGSPICGIIGKDGIVRPVSLASS